MSRLRRRDLRRATLLRCNTPLLAAWSKALIASTTAFRASSKLPWAMRSRTFFTALRARVRTAALRSLLFSEDLILFFADLVFANFYPLDLVAIRILMITELRRFVHQHLLGAFSYNQRPCLSEP